MSDASSLNAHTLGDGGVIIVTVMILIERHMVNTSVDYAGDECDNHLLTHNCACIYTNTDCD